MPTPNILATDGPTSVVKLRVRDEIRALIDRAPQAQGLSRSAFMIKAAHRAAKEALLDETGSAAGSQSNGRFLELMDRPAQSSAKLRKLMRMPAPWEDR